MSGPGDGSASSSSAYGPRSGGHAGGSGARFNDDATSSDYNPTNTSLLSTRGSLGPAGGGPGQRPAGDYITRKAGEDLRLLNEGLARELEEKEAEVRELREETHKGPLQQKLQRALQDNKDLRKRLDDIRGVQTDAATHLEDNAALLMELESVKGELVRSKHEYEQLVVALQHDNESLKDALHASDTKIGAYERETNELEEEMAAEAREKEAMRSELITMRAQLASLRSGGRVAELEEKLQSCTLLLQSKEVENDTLLREMDELTKENDQLRALQTEHIQEVTVRHANEKERAAVSMQEKQGEIQMLKGEIAAQIDRTRQLESVKIDHDATLLDLRNKMSEYERGYNLTDAVAEIRTLKTQLKKQQLEAREEKDLINRREKELQRYVAENRNLRQLAGITDESWGLNADDLALAGHIELQKLQALHRTDSKIIAKLESDRVDLLDELRKGTTDRTRDGLIYLGLSGDQTRLLEEYVERLRNGDTSLPQSDAAYDLTAKLDQARAELEAWKERYARAQVEKDEMGSKLLALMERDKNAGYETILKQITDLKVQYNMAQLSQSTPAALGGMTMPFPGMQPIPESPAARGLRSPSHQQQRSAPTPLPAGASNDLKQVAERAGQLALPERHALFARLYHEFQPSLNVVAGQQQAGSRLMSPRSGQAPADFDVPAGSGVTPVAYAPFEPTSHALLSLDARDLASMDAASKARLVGCLGELLAKERENNELLDSLELYQVRFEKLAARQQMLYIEFNNGRKSWADEKEALQQKLGQTQEEKEKVDLQLAQVQATSALVDVDDELEALRRRNLVLQTNEKVLARRFNSLEAEHAHQTSALTATRKEFVAMEHTLRLRVQELGKRSKMLETRATHVQQLVASWVPKEELLKMARKYNWMSNQYAELISTQDLRLVEANNVAAQKRECEMLKAQTLEAQAEVAIQIEKVAKLTEALAAVETTMIPNPDPQGARAKKSLASMMAASQQSSGIGSGSATPATSTTQSIPSLLAELADVRARESAASKRCVRLDENLGSLNQHSLSLEEELLVVRRKHHELSLALKAEQEVVLELRNQVEGAVPYFKVNQLQQQLLESSERLAECQAHIGHYKEIADLANHQSIALMNLRPEDPRSSEHEELVRDLQETVASLESSSDDAARIGRVHRENMHLKLSIRGLEKELAEMRTKSVKLEQQHALMEKELDIKHTDLYRLHNHARAQLSEKEKTILALTSHASTATNPNALNHPMTLQQAETIHQATLRMQQQLEAEQQKAAKLKEENDKYQLQTAELTINLQAARELAAIMPATTTRTLGSSSRGRGAGAPIALTFDDDDAAGLPASLSLAGGGATSTVIDPAELNLKLRQNLVKYSNELSKYKLAEVKSAHALASLQSKLDFQANELHSYEVQLAKLQQELVEKDLYIQTKENDFKEQYLYLKEQETKLKLSESLKRMDATKANKRQQQNAAQTIRRMTGQQPGADLKLADHVDEGDEDDPFAVHDRDGRTVDVDDLDVDALTALGDDLDATQEQGGEGPRMVHGVLLQMQAKLRLAKQVMADQRAKLEDLEAENERIQALKTADGNALAAAQEVAQLERARLLSTAQATIQNLNEQLNSKNARIEKYQEMLETAQGKFKQRKLQDDVEIERLNQALLEANTKNLGKLSNAMTFLDEMPRLPKDVVSRVEAESLVKEKEHLVALMHKEIEFLKLKCSDEAEAREMIDQEMKNLYAASTSEVNALKADIAALQAAKQDDAKMAKLIGKLRGEMAEKDAAVGKMQDAMAQLKDEVLASAGDYRKMAAAVGDANEDAAGLADPATLRKQVATLERKLKAQVALVAKEQKATREAADQATAAADGVTQKLEQIASLEAALRTRGEEMDTLRLDLIKSQNAHAKSKELHAKHKVRTAAEVEELKTHHEKEKDLATRRAKIAAKSEPVKDRPASSSRAPPSASASGDEEKDASGNAALASRAFNDWEAEKKAGKKLATLQVRAQKQQAEVKAYQEAMEQLARKLEREQKDKLDLFQRYTALQAQLQQAKQLSGSSFANLDPATYDDATSGSMALTDAELEKLLTKEALKQKLFDLQATNDALQRRLQVDVPAHEAQLKEDAAAALRKAETFLREKREAERALKDATGSGAILKSQRNKSSIPSDSTDGATPAALETALSQAEQRILELTMANLDLKYSSEHGAILVGRLRARLQDLSQLMRLIDGNYLAKEWQELVPPEVRDFIDSVQEGRERDASSSSTDPLKPAQQQRALTLILSTFKRIFEKLKGENEGLKKNSQSNLDYMAVIKENKHLKKKVATAAAAAAAEREKENKPAVTMPPVVVTDPSGKEVDVNTVSRADLERSYSLHTLTRRELKKEQDLNARLKKKMADLTAQLEAAQQQLTEAEKRVQSAASGTSAEWFRKEKNYLASISDLTREKQAADEEIRKLKTTMREMRAQMRDMGGLIAHVRTQQSHTQEQVLAAAQVQAAVLSQSEAEGARDAQTAAALRAAEAERDRLARENAALKHELSAFDENFFEELEQLKYGYSQAVQQTHQLQSQIDHLKAAGKPQ